MTNHPEKSKRASKRANKPTTTKARKVIARKVIFGSQHDQIIDRLTALDTDLAGHIQSFAYDTIYDQAGLDLKTKELMACALLVSLGSPLELRTHRRT